MQSKSPVPATLTATASVHADLIGVQYIRAAAALMVVFDHVSAMIAERKYFGEHPFSGFFESGAVGVDLFFCLSGFIIVYITLSPDLTPKVGPFQFFMRRFTRIIPFMWVMIATYAAFRAFARGHFPLWAYMRGISLFPVGSVEPNQVWTLRNEFLFYVIFAVSFLQRKKWIFLLWALTPIGALWLLPPFDPGSGFVLQLMAFLFNGLNLLFGLGAITGMFYVRQKHRWPTIHGSNLALAVALGCVFAAASILSFGRWGVTQVHDADALWRIMVIGILSCLCLTLACSVVPSQKYFGKLCKTLGDSSYAIYLSHPLFVSALLGLAASHFRSFPISLIMIIVIMVSATGGVLISRYIEVPIVALSKRILSSRLKI